MVTKFKTDKESLRKPANLIRLEDVIKEVKKNNITSKTTESKIQRLKEEIRSLNLYISSKQLNSYKEILII